MEKPMLKFIYALFIGILLAVFIGVGVDAFYPAPKAPTYPTVLNETGKIIDGTTVTQTDEQKAAQKEFDRLDKEYQDNFKVYSRNVSIITLILAVIVLVISLLTEKKLEIISEGLLLGGVFTLGYSIIRGFMSEDAKYRFIVLTIGLVIAIAVGYYKFLYQKELETKKAK